MPIHGTFAIWNRHYRYSATGIANHSVLDRRRSLLSEKLPWKLSCTCFQEALRKNYRKVPATWGYQSSWKAGSPHWYAPLVNRFVVFANRQHRKTFKRVGYRNCGSLCIDEAKPGTSRIWSFRYRAGRQNYGASLDWLAVTSALLWRTSRNADSNNKSWLPVKSYQVWMLFYLVCVFGVSGYRVQIDFLLNGPEARNLWTSILNCYIAFYSAPISRAGNMPYSVMIVFHPQLYIHLYLYLAKWRSFMKQ